MDETGVALERAWSGTCKVLFGQELGSYKLYSKWLRELVDAPSTRKSCILGKEVIHSTNNYRKSAPSISLDEVDFHRKFPPLNLNEIKDIDSISEAVKDRVAYAGNMILGNSRFIEKSSNVNDSFYVSDSTICGNSKYMAYCTLTRHDSYGFGGNAFSQCDFCLKCHELTRVKRSFELWMSQDCEDCYYSHGLKNCSNCIFCFNLQNKRNAIGNQELPPDKFRQIRAKLISEMAEELKAKKRLPSLIEIVGKEKKAPKIRVSAPAPEEQKDKGKIEAAFSKTMQLIFGVPHSKGIDFYADWLTMHTRGFERHKSAASKKEVFLAHYGNYSDLPKDRLLNLEEAQEFGKSAKAAPDEIGGISLSNAHSKISEIAFFNTGIQDGQNPNDIECTINIEASNCYRTVCSVYSKYCGCSFWPRSSEHAFGCDSVFDTGFCVNCYHSVRLSRCFEMDSCNSCMDCMFCHNCENLQNSMFCFNTKNKNYAIGNVEVGREEYLRIKKLVLDEINSELEKTGKLKRSVFSF
ncbi:hypothetical protein JW721_04090 [Candidatus Micrarchaeota archaeon]|nr:hypothetical protein [Candidatus Micrarchaeota archaeon]